MLWTTWNEFSLFAMSVASIVIFCEITEEYADIKKLQTFMSEKGVKMSRDICGDVFCARAFTLHRITSITDDANLVERVEVIKQVPSLEVYLTMI